MKTDLETTFLSCGGDGGGDVLRRHRARHVRAALALRRRRRALEGVAVRRSREVVYDRGEQVPANSIYVEYGPSAKWILSNDVGRMIKKINPAVAAAQVCSAIWRIDYASMLLY